MRSLLALSLVSCAGTFNLNGDDAVTSSSAVISLEAAAQTAALASIFVEPLSDPASTATAEAAAAKAATGTSLLSAGSASATSSINVTTYTFTNSDGPYGLRNLNGQVRGKFTALPGGALALELTSSGLKIGETAVELQANTEITGSSTRRDLILTAATAASLTIKERENSGTHTGELSARWDGTCMSLKGSYMTTVEGRVWATDVSNYQRCQNDCPKAGGRMLLQSVAGRGMTMRYEGTSDVNIVTSSGTNGVFPLSCGS